MRDFPPPVTAWTDRSAGAGDPSVPDTRSAGRLLWWFVRHQGWLFVACIALSLTWVMPSALAPWVLGKAVDEGIVPGDSGRLTFWVTVLLLVTVIGASSGVLYHTTAVRSWLVALYGTISLVTHKSASLGHILPRRVPTGEVLSVSGSDSNQFGGFLEVTSRAIGELVALVVIAVIVLRINTELGIVILLVAPVLVITSMPLLRPMGNAQTRERTRDSELTGRATDIVAGLRILRGIGGEQTFGTNYATQSQRVRDAGVRAGGWQALVEALGVLLSGMFVVVLMWLGIREVQAGRLLIGELITFLGYALFLLQPIRTFFFLVQKATRSFVSARKTASVLGQDVPWPQQPAHGLEPRLDLVDDWSGLVVRPGELTVVVSADPDVSAALADRLGRYLPREGDPLSMDADEEAKGRSAARARAAAEKARQALQERDRESARRLWGVRLGDVDLAEVPLDEVRRTILVSDTGAFVFAGTLQDAIDPHGRCTRQEAEAALLAAAAEDVYDALPGGWQGRLDERGRGLSGGQRQRLVLARALAVDPDILVLVEPTSAVDAHTESRIAERLRAHRREKTTVIMSVSPLLLHHADQVAFLVDGQVSDHGSHDDLVRRSDAYRSVVLRGEVLSGDEVTA
ncbi:MAG: ABC transporter ATP-binding protein [Intrasporangiaceae bacterium]|nr:ABC transporter ATP-binding protein [Intrasporangiaceae bacterium]